MLEKFDLTHAKVARTPAAPGEKLTKDMSPQTDAEKEMMKDVPYMNLVGALMWPAAMTRADISEAHHQLTKFNRDPGPAHWEAAQRVARYLKGTKRHGLLIDGTGITFTDNGDGTETLDQPVIFHCDADYAGDLDDRKSTSGLHVQIAGAMVTWRAKKQGSVTLSTMESELIAIGDAVVENEYIDALLLEMGIKIAQPSIIMEDNQSAIAYTKGGKNELKARHVGVRFHYIRNSVNDGRIRIEYCPTTEMLADIFTKALPADQFEYLRKGIGISEIPAAFRRKREGNKPRANKTTISGEWECLNRRITPQ